jgi:predicted nucleotidyltransferase
MRPELMKAATRTDYRVVNPVRVPLSCLGSFDERGSIPLTEYSVSRQTTPFRPISGRTRSKICQYSRKVDSESASTVLVKSQPPTLDELRSKLLSFCQKHTVQKLEVFGSVAEGTAKPGSDIDLMITLKPGSAESLHEFVGLQLELEDLLGCPVDLLERLAVESMKNPFKRRSMLSCVKLLYAA